MSRAPAYSNEDVLDDLRSAGYVPHLDFVINNLRYFVPMKIYTKATGQKFTPQLEKGRQVTLRNYTKRKERGRWGDSVVENQRFRHYGMGSDRDYGLDERPKTTKYGYRYNYLNNPFKIRVGNDFTYNKLAARNKVKALTKLGYRSEWVGWKGQKHRQEIKANYFEKSIKFTLDGVFGPKKIILGNITETYVFFKESWERRREARYKVLWENGAEGVFTGDYLDYEYGTDYDQDDRIYQCSHGELCTINLHCEHKICHMLNKTPDPCKTICHDEPNSKCMPVLDYYNFIDSTHGCGIVIEDEDEK